MAPTGPQPHVTLGTGIVGLALFSFCLHVSCLLEIMFYFGVNMEMVESREVEGSWVCGEKFIFTCYTHIQYGMVSMKTTNIQVT